MYRVFADKLASATKNVPLRKEVRCRREVVAREGYLVAGRIHGEKAVYNVLENREGRMVPLHDGDTVVGVFGQRNALHGYSGYVPEAVQAGDVLHVLNLGGVVGKCTSINPDVGEPFGFEVLGGVLVFPEFDNRTGTPAHVGMNAIEDGAPLGPVPVVFVAGTCMNSGKTSAACQIVRALSLKGLKVGGCKLTGVSLLRDALHMEDHGASWAVSFVDAGVVTTSPENAAPTARRLLAHLSQRGAEVVVAELGDGLLGRYGVSEILADPEIMGHKKVLVLCASDPVGAWGGVKLLGDSFGLTVDLISGPTTDNLAGTQYIEASLGIRALNARTSGAEMGKFVLDAIGRPRRTR
jgi:hypothetical protein